MLYISRHRTVVALTAITLFSFANIALAGSVDIRILKKALTNALGEKSNFGTERLVTVREELKEGGKTLVVGVIANNSPTTAGLRHGIFTDVVKVLRVLKSWNWPDKVDRVMIGEYLPQSRGPDLEARPVMTCVISSANLRAVNWDSFDPRRVPEIVDAIKLYDPIKLSPKPM